MKIKTQDLTGAALDWAVAKAEGMPLTFKGRKWPTDGGSNSPGAYVASLCWSSYNPSTDWAQGGPIIEREGILFARTNDGEMYRAWIVRRNASAIGPTHMIAAMRCYVASRLGGEVDIPEDLT
jgi:hypothetical protein